MLRKLLLICNDYYVSLEIFGKNSETYTLAVKL